MEVPALIEAAGKRVPHIVKMHFPGGMHPGDILRPLIGGQGFVPMDRHRHDRGRAVRQPDARAGERDLHDLLGELTRGMLHPLIGGRDVDAGRVVVRPEVGA